MFLRSYKERLPAPTSDAEFIDDDVYASEPDPATEMAPQGLVDRLYMEQDDAMPEGYPRKRRQNPVPTTRNTIT